MKEYVNTFMRYRFLLGELVKKGIKLKYRRSYLGIIWSLLEPLLTMMVLTIVFGTLFGNKDKTFPVYILTGRLLYSYYSSSTTRALKSVRANAAMIKKVYVPKYIYPLSSVLYNYVIFLMIEKYTTVEEKQHEEEMIQREILYRNEYYQDMERYQEQIQDIRHDMKNRLTGLLAAAEQGSAELIKDRLQEVLGDIRLAEEIIYSANPVVNAILKVKSVKAKEKEIPMQVTTLLPQRVSVDIGDMGVLYGNLLDNAIEAAMAVEQEKRYVHVESKFQEGRLLLSIKNSKPSGTSSCQQTSKKDKIKHGRGIRSVRKVAEKYGGELMLKDQGEHFEAVLLLNGVAKLE